MTEEMKDRPAALVRRGPRPAPDEKVDPVEVTPAARPQIPQPTAEVIAPSIKKIGRPAGRREITVPLGTRLSVEVMQILDDAVAEHGVSIRAAVEQAIISRWSKDQTPTS